MVHRMASVQLQDQPFPCHQPSGAGVACSCTRRVAGFRTRHKVGAAIGISALVAGRVSRVNTCWGDAPVLCVPLPVQATPATHFPVIEVYAAVTTQIGIHKPNQSPSRQSH
jgi:hypothetical protein